MNKNNIHAINDEVRKTLEMLHEQLTQKGGGDGGSDDTKERLAKIEGQIEGIEKRLGNIENNISKLPGEWEMAKVVILVVGGMMTAAFFAPRLLSMIQ